MKNISINGRNRVTNLEREIELNNGAIVILKNGNDSNNVDSVYMVVSFRDNKNRYNGERTNKYCTLLNLDEGEFVFEERCSRKTTVRRVLNHLLNLGCTNYAYNQSIPVESYRNYDIEVYRSGEYTIDIAF